MNTQPVNFKTATVAFTIQAGATAVTVYANGTTVTIANDSGQSIVLPDGVSWGVEAGAGNTLGELTITPAGADALITWLQ